MKPSKELLAVWDNKLKASGFKDIEGGMSKANNSCFSDGKVSTARRKQIVLDQIEYYRLAGLFLHHYELFTTNEKAIWELHCEGLASREISKRTGIYLKTVQKIIRELKKKLVDVEFIDQD